MSNVKDCDIISNHHLFVGRVVIVPDLITGEVADIPKGAIITNLQYVFTRIQGIHESYTTKDFENLAIFSKSTNSHLCFLLFIYFCFIKEKLQQLYGHFC